MATMIEVTQGDIDNGLRDCTNCPVALAVNRAMCQSVKVTPTRIEFISGGRWATSLGVYLFINHFDAGLPVKPFKFEIDVPDLYLR